MAINVTLPQLGLKGSSTKDLIISILSEEWPLSAKEIFARVQKSGAEVSYQAVHKLLLQFCEGGVLEKEGVSYQLSKGWISRIKQFATSLEKRYEGKDAFLSELSTFRGSFEFTFNNVTDFSLGMAAMLLSERCAKSKGTCRLAVLRHGWWPLTFQFDQFLLLRKIVKLHSAPYCIIRKDSPFARWLNKQYNLIGFNSKIVDGLKDYNDDIAIIGSLIVQVNYSKETKKVIDELYARTPGLTALFKEYVVSTFPQKKVEINFKVSENSSLAATLGKHYLKVWKGS